MQASMRRGCPTVQTIGRTGTNQRLPSIVRFDFARHSGLAIADRMLDLERYFREDGASTITDDVRRVTGRAPRRFADYVRDTTPTGVWNTDVASAVS